MGYVRVEGANESRYLPVRVRQMDVRPNIRTPRGPPWQQKAGRGKPEVSTRPLDWLYINIDLIGVLFNPRVG